VSFDARLTGEVSFARTGSRPLVSARGSHNLGSITKGLEQRGLGKDETMKKRELINTGSDKRFVRRDKQGQFKESDDVGRSLAADGRQKAKTKSKAGHGDKGDR
jgi:hypothetical protein